MALEHIVEHLVAFFSTVIIYYFRTYSLIKSAVSDILTPFTNRFDLFEILLFWTIIIIVISSLISKTRYAMKHGFANTITTWVVRKIRKIPFIEKEIDKELAGISKGLDIDINKHRDPVKTLEIPQQGVSEEALRRKLTQWQKVDYKIYGEKKITGCLYYNESEKLHSFVKDVAKDYLYINPLHFDLFPMANQMEGEIISMVKKLFNGDDKVCGIVTSGGTESIMSAMLAYREWGRARGIEEPEIVAPVTAHVAFNKAAFYYGMLVKSVPVDIKTGVCNPADIEKLINKNTVCLVGSFPNYPYGTVDQIEELSEMARKRGIGFHCDCCLGSFLVPFADKFGVNTGLFDFRLKGVTSISVDPHKYGLAPKGISVVLFKNNNLRRGTIYSCISWPGGIYATPTHAGSRGHSPIAGAWVAMMATGYNGYMDKAGKIIEATRRCVKKLNEISGIQVVGNPELGVVSFIATHKNLNCYDLTERIGQRGWKLAALQRPAAVHLAITNYNIGQIEDFLAAVKWGVAEVIKNPAKKKGDLAQIYGSAAVLPENLVQDGARVLIEAVLKP